MNERLDSEETIQKNTAPKSIQLGFGWAPPSSNLKQSLSKSLVQEKFTDGFLTSLFSQSRKSEGSRFIQNIIDKDSDLIFIKDRDQRFAMANTSIGEIYGVNPSELLAKRDSDFNPNHREVNHFSTIDEEVFTTGKERLIGAETVTDSNGTRRTFRTIKVPIINCDGKVTHLLGIASDITAHYESLLFKKLLASTVDPVSKMLSLCAPEGLAKRPSVGKNGILVVDDDQAVREVTSEILQGAGYQVYTAADGYEGFSTFLENSKNIRLIILDMAMPHIDGEELFRQLRKVAPWVAVVVCSALQEKSVLKSISPDEFLGKPYDPKLLLKVVTKFLE